MGENGEADCALVATATMGESGSSESDKNGSSGNGLGANGIGSPFNKIMPPPADVWLKGEAMRGMATRAATRSQ